MNFRVYISRRCRVKMEKFSETSDHEFPGTTCDSQLVSNSFEFLVFLKKYIQLILSTFWSSYHFENLFFTALHHASVQALKHREVPGTDRIIEHAVTTDSVLHDTDYHENFYGRKDKFLRDESDIKIVKYRIIRQIGEVNDSN